MTKQLVVSVFSFLVISSISASAQTATIPNTALLDVVSGNEVSLKQYGKQKAVVLLFTSNYCPFSRLYEQRVADLIGNYDAGEVAFLLINPNSEAERDEESEDAMKKKAAEWNRSLPYLSDKGQVWASALGATKTPEVFVLTPKAGKLTVFYSGALDDNPQVAEDVSQAYLAKALEQAVQGKTTTLPKQRPVGCMIKRIGN